MPLTPTRVERACFHISLTDILPPTAARATARFIAAPPRDGAGTLMLPAFGITDTRRRFLVIFGAARGKQQKALTASADFH